MDDPSYMHSVFAGPGALGTWKPHTCLHIAGRASYRSSSRLLWCALTIRIGGEPVTRVSDRRTKGWRNSVYGSVFPLCRWFVEVAQYADEFMVDPTLIERQLENHRVARVDHGRRDLRPW